VIFNFCLIGNIRHNFLVTRMIESASMTFMPIHTQDLNRVHSSRSVTFKHVLMLSSFDSFSWFWFWPSTSFSSFSSSGQQQCCTNTSGKHAQKSGQQMTAMHAEMQSFASSSDVLITLLFDWSSAENNITLWSSDDLSILLEPVCWYDSMAPISSSDDWSILLFDSFSDDLSRALIHWYMDMITPMITCK